MASQFYKHYSQIKPEDWRWKNFAPKKIACKGDGSILIDEASMDALQKFRQIVGVPVMINSAYRSEAYNKSVGGAPKSQHVLGKAFDIRITDKLSRDTIHAAAEMAGFHGFGDYNSFVHIDTGAKRKWDLRS